MSKTEKHVPILCQSPNGQELANFRGDTGRLAKETIVDHLESKAKIEHNPSPKRDKCYPTSSSVRLPSPSKRRSFLSIPLTKDMASLPTLF